MLSLIKFVFFLFSCTSFGFIVISRLTSINAIHLLIPFSVSFGISSFLFICHILSYFLGPQLSSLITILILFITAILIYLIKKLRITNALTTNQLIVICSIALVISLLSFLSVFRFGTFDKEFHFQLALTLFHNNVYPPRDFFKPEYVLLYHFGGDLLAGSIHHLCNIEIARAYELISTIFSGIFFLSFFALAWTLTKNYQLSLLSGFCTYFGGGLLWLDSIIRYLFKIAPQSTFNWNFLQTFLNVGIEGGIINAPSLLAFSSTSGIGIPILIFCLVIILKIFEEIDLKTSLIYILFLSVALFSLFLTAEWLYMTFWAGVIPHCAFILIFKKNQKQTFISIAILLLISVLLSKTIGNALFMQDSLQTIGRANIFNLGVKENLFSVTSWGRLNERTMNYQKVSCFSWNFISEFGLSLFLIPFIVLYLKRFKNDFALLLFLMSVFTMPLPIFVDFKLNPVDANRLFGFGNQMMILLTTISLGTLYKFFLQNKLITVSYLLVFCLSPLSGLIAGSIFTPYIFSSKVYVEEVSRELKNVHSIYEFKKAFNNINLILWGLKNNTLDKYINEIEFLKKNSKPKDVAIGSLTDIPTYAGIYSIIPANKWLYKDLLYSSYDSTFLTILTTLDPNILNELNIKWIILSNDSKKNLPLETQKLLLNADLFKLVYLSQDKNYEIYHTETSKSPPESPKTAWILVNDKGQPCEIVHLNSNTITLFPRFKDALAYLKSAQNLKPDLKKVLITSQAIAIDTLERQIKDSMLNITLDKKF